MPLFRDDMYGTGENGLPIEDYCVHCYKDGEFTEDVTMDEMIRLCVRYVQGNSRNVAMVSMKLQYPRLKRWARKEETQHEYHKSINRVLEYIQDHLHQEMELKTLASVANISPYHFHRIFKSTIGESVAAYVQRLRLEYVAEQLKDSPLSLGELAEKTGYSSEQALSRAFKKYFNIPPTVFKASFFQEKYGNELTPRVCKVAEKYIIYLREEKPDTNSWQRLYMYAIINRLLTDTTESIEIIKDRNYHPCLSTGQLVTPNKHVDSITLPDGLYAIFTHKGSLGKIPELFQTIMYYWMPKSKYKLTPLSMPYVKFLNNPTMVKEEDLLTEIYVPVTEK